MKGYYINLEKREDRKNHIENNIKKKYSFFSNIERMNAIWNENGGIGCGLSHIKCLTKLKLENEKYYMILEDDFFIFNDDAFKNFESEFDKIKELDNWDIIVLTPRGDTINFNYISNFHRINNNQTATGYIIKHEMVNYLEDLFKEGIVNLMKNENPNIWAIDQVWKRIQNTHVFLYYKSLFGGQLEGYSDIERKYVNYNERFKNQVNY